jgi:hypothetical protein
MISNITGHSGIVVHGGQPISMYLSPSQPGMPASGQLRYNNNFIEVFDGVSWCSITQHCSITLDSDTQVVVQWAKQKMQEDRELENLAKEYPMLADAMRDLEVIKTLVKGKRNHDIQQS